MNPNRDDALQPASAGPIDPLLRPGTLVEEVAQALLHKQASLCCAESCTGGLIAAACTELPGSSQWFDRAWVTYSNAAKTELLQVSAQLLHDHGAVSEPVALAMAQGALQASSADWAVAVTGIAGPAGGTPAKPVGTVWIAWAQRQGPAWARRLQIDGDRQAVRAASVKAALEGLLEGLGQRRQSTSATAALALKAGAGGP